MAHRVQRFIELSETENTKLRVIEQNQHMNAKVRLRAQILRLSKQGMSIEQISEQVGIMKRYGVHLSVGKQKAIKV